MKYVFLFLILLAVISAIIALKHPVPTEKWAALVSSVIMIVFFSKQLGSNIKRSRTKKEFVKMDVWSIE